MSIGKSPKSLQNPPNHPKIAPFHPSVFHKIRPKTAVFAIPTNCSPSRPFFAQLLAIETKPDIARRLQAIRHVALDLDGTIYNGAALLPSSNPFLSLIGELGIGHTFLTNNPSKSNEDYLNHLRSFGLNATADQLYTSTLATIAYLRALHPAPQRLFILGTPSMCAEFTAASFQLVEPPESDPPHAPRTTHHAPLPTPHSEVPDAVVIGFDTTLTYPRLCRAAWWIKQGKPFIATNPDRVCPTDQPTVLVDCGSICAMLTIATGRAPDAVMGKPDPAMLRGILERHQLQPAQLAMAGDRLYTDMEMARRAGALGVLVLTGETTAAEAAASDLPSLVVRDLAELGTMLRAAKSP